MKRSLISLLLAAAALVVACDDEPLGPGRTGTIVLDVVSADAALAPPAAAPVAAKAPTTRVLPSPATPEGKVNAPTLSAGALLAFDKVTVRVSGPSNRSVDLTLNTGNNRWEGEVTGLNPGSYTVQLLGFTGSEVSSFGETGSPVTVVAGKKTTATVTFASFVPTVSDITSPTKAVTFGVTISTIAAAESYVVQWADNAAFTGAAEVPTDVTSATIGPVPAPATYYVRAKAVVAGVANGKYSDPKTVTVQADAIGSTGATGTPLGYMPTRTENLTDLNILPAGDQDFWTFGACKGDTLLATLTSATTSFQPSLILERGGTADTVANATTLQRVLRVSGAYAFGVTGASNTVGQYQVALQVKKGAAANPSGQNCAFEPPTAVLVTPGGQTISNPGGSVSYTAEALDSIGQPIAGKTFTWTSLNPAVATADAGSGQVTAVTSGQATIRAQTDGVPGFGLVTVAVPSADSVTVWAEYSSSIAGATAVWGVSIDNVWIIGTDGSLLHYVDGTPTTVTSPTTDSLLAIWGSAANNIFAAGAKGTIIRYDGTQWTKLSLPGGMASQTFRAIWGTGPNDVYAVGTGGTILHYTGAEWLVQTSPTGQNLNAVWGTARNSVYAAGAAGTVLKNDGSGWQSLSGVGTTNVLRALWGTADQDFFVVGDGGVILHYTGSFTAMTSNTTADLRGIWGTTNGEIYAAGGTGVVVRYFESVWHPGTPPTTVPLYGVWGAPGGGVFLGGGSGKAVLGYRGATVEVSPTSQAFDALGRTTTLTAQAREKSGGPISGAVVVYRWTSLDEAVATVNPVSGVATAVGAGTGTIRVRASGGASAEASVTVDPRFTGSISADAAGFADEIHLTPGSSYAWTGAETVTIGGRQPYYAYRGPERIIVRVPDVTPAAAVEVVIGNQGGAYTQFDTIQITSEFVPHMDPGTAPLVPVGVPGAANFFISLQEENNEYYTLFQLARAQSMLLYAELDWQTNANLDVLWLNYNLSELRGPTDGAGSNRPEVTANRIPADSAWMLTFVKNVDGAPPTMAHVYLASKTLGTALTTGFDHTCTIDLTGDAWCWGYNYYGNVGVDTTRQLIAEPVRVQGGLKFRSIGAGGYHTCAISETGAAYCWGADYAGQLGDAAGGAIALGSGLPLTGGTPLTPRELRCRIPGNRDPACLAADSLPPAESQDGPRALDSSTPVAVAGGLTFQSISGGYEHTCGLTPSGEAYCWGANYYGQLGNNDGSLATQYSPVAVAGGITFQQIDAGIYHTCGLAVGGAVYCWGYGYDYQIGNGATGYWITPQLVSTGPFLQVTAGYPQSCALGADQQAYCWGGNYSGEVGTGVSPTTYPGLVQGGLTFRYLGAGLYHTCGVTANRDVYCWGQNYEGQLGDGNTNTQSGSPVRAATASAAQVVAAGGQHTCAVDTYGALSCWGANNAGQLGNGVTPSVPAPIDNPGALTLHRPAGGRYHTCALTSTAGTGSAYCWGYNPYGQLGNGTSGYDPVYDPQLVGGGLQLRQIRPDKYYSTCGIDGSSRAWCWGYNGYGQLGDSTYNSSVNPVLVRTTGTFQQLAGGFGFYCGISATTAQAWCWGRNNYGALGDNTTVQKNYPVLVSGGLTFTQITAGYYHACGLRGDGSVYCWGYNYQGQLGDGTYGAGTNKLVPTQVVGSGSSLIFTQVVALGYSTCGITTTNTAYCWGYNYYGQLGNGTSGSGTDQNLPTAVTGGIAFTSLAQPASGVYHMCGLTSSGTAYCWGYNGYGNLGDGTYTQRNSPTAVLGGLTFANITVGGYFTCGEAGGTVQCWGYAYDGELGRRINQPLPGPVVGGITAQSTEPGIVLTTKNASGTEKVFRLPLNR